MDTRDAVFKQVHSAIESAEASAGKWLERNVFTQQYIYETLYPVIQSVEKSENKRHMGDGLWYYLEAYLSNDGEFKIVFGNEVNRSSRVEFKKNRTVTFWDYQDNGKATPKLKELIDDIDVSKQVAVATKLICNVWEIEI